MNLEADAFVKIIGKWCSKHYYVTDSFASAIEECESSEHCSMFYQPDCFDKKFFLCKQQPGIRFDSSSRHCLFMKGKSNFSSSWKRIWIKIYLIFFWIRMNIWVNVSLYFCVKDLRRLNFVINPISNLLISANQQRLNWIWLLTWQK